jgi:hypothetical protein
LFETEIILSGPDTQALSMSDRFPILNKFIGVAPHVTEASMPPILMKTKLMPQLQVRGMNILMLINVSAQFP